MATCGQLCHKDVRTLRLAASEPDALAFSPDGRWLAVGFWNGKAIEVWTADGSRKVFTLEGHSAPVHCLAFRRDSRLLASGGGDGTVRLWDMDTGKTVKILGFHGIVAEPETICIRRFVRPSFLP